MAPPKKKKAGGPPDQAISNKEAAYIRNNIATLINNPATKEELWKSKYTGLKKNAADREFMERKAEWEAQIAPAAAANDASASKIPSQSSTVPTRPSSSPNMSDATSEEPQDTTLGNEPGAQHSIGDEDAQEEQVLVNNENTTRSMAAATDATIRTTEGDLLSIDSFDFAIARGGLNVTHAPYPIRADFPTPASTVFTNRFKISINEGAVFYEFHILGIPEGRAKRMTEMFVDTAIEKSAVLKRHQDCFATDHTKTIVSWKDLRKELNERAKWNPQTKGWHLVDVQDGEHHTVSLYLQFVRVVDTKHLESYVASEPGDSSWNPLTWNESTVVNALNIVISKCFSGGVFRQGSNKYFVETGWSNLGPASSPLCTIRGYFYSTRPGMGHILLNVNSCTSAFFRPITLSKLMTQDTKKLLGHDWPSVLTGLRVYINYERGRGSDDKELTINKEESRIKKICGLGRPCNEQNFTLLTRNEAGEIIDEEEIDVAKYLWKEYKLELSEPGLEAVNLGSRHKPSWFPPEKLIIMPYQIYRRAVPSSLTKPMLDIACKSPDTNRGLIEGEGMDKLMLNQDSQLSGVRSIPLKISNIMLKVGCSKIPYPKITYGDSVTETIEASKAHWDLRKQKFLLTKADALPYVVLRDSYTDQGNITELRQNFERQLRDRAVGQPNCLGEFEIKLGRGSKLTEEQFKQTLKLIAGYDLKMVVLVLQRKDQDNYSTFKYLMDRVFGFHSLVMIEDSNKRQRKWASTGLDQYCGNITMKANLKMGGINHMASSKQGNIEEWLKTTLVLGADVTHPGNGALIGCPSVAAVVGSVESTAGRFLGSFRLQSEGGKEIIDLLQEMVYDRLIDWYNVNRALPKNILYFRDGVSDGQYSQVRDDELKQIRNAYDEFDKNFGPGRGKGKQKDDPKSSSVNLTAVICTKRHHTRFYPRKTADKQANGNQNCRPGTIVESGVTHPYFTDFYLQSHNGLKGTAKPAYYWVLENGMDIKMLDLQHLTFNLFHTYVRATMGVSYAAPAYYADRLCERARCYLRDFYVPTQHKREELETRRWDLEKKHKILSPKAFDKKAEDKKTREQEERERAAIKKAREAVEQDLKQYTREQVEDRLNGHTKDKAYNRKRCDEVALTMFWM